MTSLNCMYGDSRATHIKVTPMICNEKKSAEVKRNDSYKSFELYLDIYSETLSLEDEGDFNIS